MIATEYLTIRGAREHNLRNLTCELPRNRLVVVSGLSGSGKSTLAFDIVFSEGQRRYVECLSPYARQFLRVRARPDIEAIEGVPPTVAVEQHTSFGGRKSTIATMSGVNDFLRLLFARVGTPRCPRCDVLAEETGPEALRKALGSPRIGREAILLTPVIRGRRGHHRPALDRLASRGIEHVRVDGTLYPIDEVPPLQRYAIHDIDAVWQSIDDGAVKEAMALSGGHLVVMEKNGREHLFSDTCACPKCGRSFQKPDPREFSFNSRAGACSRCEGYGEVATLAKEVMAEWKDSTVRRFLRGILPSKAYPKEERNRLLEEFETHGIKKLSRVGKLSPKHTDHLSLTVASLLRETLSGELRDRTRRYLESLLIDSPCRQCHGARLSQDAMMYEVYGLRLPDIMAKPVEEARACLDRVKPEGKKAKIARPILAELTTRLRFLDEVGLGYLTLDRAGPTLAGGEMQRVRLASLVRSGLKGALFVLDEPTIGLHPRDNRKLIDVFRALVDSGNGVLVVEHDEETIQAADWVIDLGPGGGSEGGSVVATAPPEELAQHPHSPTGQALACVPPSPRAANIDRETGISLVGACYHNLKGIDVTFPQGTLTVVTGVSGSGKSSLVMGCLETAMRLALDGEKPPRSRLRSIHGYEAFARVAVVDHTPIGRTPRSTPATYIKVFDEIRKLFAATEEAKARGFGPARFSFNSTTGRCGHCEGQGQIRMEMAFLPDVYQPCEECDQKRYGSETLVVTYKGKTIAEVLDLSIEEGAELFRHHPKIGPKLETLVRTGLGYLKLGQASPTLSGGEAQRVKLAAELGGSKRGQTLYLLDEPSTGLHRLDVFKLIEVLQSLAESGHTIVVIEHHLDVMAAADHIVDLGPEGGDGGGELLSVGAPKEVLKNWRRSPTARALREHLKTKT